MCFTYACRKCFFQSDYFTNNNLRNYNKNINLAKRALITSGPESAYKFYLEAFENTDICFCNDVLVMHKLSSFDIDFKIPSYCLDKLKKCKRFSLNKWKSNPLYEIYRQDQKTRSDSIYMLYNWQEIIKTQDSLSCLAFINLFRSDDRLSEARFGYLIREDLKLWDVIMVLSNHFTTIDTNLASNYLSLIDLQFLKGNIPIDVYGYILQIFFDNTKGNLGKDLNINYLCKIDNIYLKALSNNKDIDKINLNRLSIGLDSFKISQKLYIYDRICADGKDYELMPFTLYNNYNSHDFPEKTLIYFQRNNDISQIVKEVCYEK